MEIENNRGFVIIFAITLSSIILAMALGIANIALQEIKFITSAKDTNNAFFAADTGAECALFYDKPPSFFPLSGPATPIVCAAVSVTPAFSGTFNTGLYSFVVAGLEGGSCAKVTVLKDGAVNPPYTATTVTSDGYNIGDALCNWSNPERIERELIVTY